MAIELQRVLVVDDQPSVVRDVGRMFRSIADIEIDGATDTASALRLARTNAPELAIVDLILQRGDPQTGLRVIADLHAQFPSIVIGAISGSLTDELEVQSHAAGAKWCLQKPFSREQLLYTVLANDPPAPSILDVGQTFEAVKQVHLDRVLHANGGSVSAAARVLGVPRTTVQRMKRRKR